MSAFGLAARLGIRRRGRAIIDAISRSTGIRQEMERCKESADAWLRAHPLRAEAVVPNRGEGPVRRQGPSVRHQRPLPGGAAKIIKRAIVRLPRGWNGRARRAHAAAGA